MSSYRYTLIDIPGDRLKRLSPPLRERADEFVGLLNGELDSWFSCEVACCDSCYDDFLAHWPLIYSRDAAFQESGMPLSCIYDGSRLRSAFTEAEFQELVGQAACPRCGAALTANIWPYRLPCGDQSLEDEFRKIAEIAARYPFLVLSHPLAKKVLEEIQATSESAPITELSNSLLFRARRRPGIEDPKSDDFLPPPPHSTPEGRYNHAGKPALYLATDAKTCFVELGNPDEGVWLAELDVRLSGKVLALNLFDSPTETICALVASSLMSAPSGDEAWHRPEYVFTRFVSDCAREAGFCGIRYSSVSSGSGENIVLFGSRDQFATSIVLRSACLRLPTDFGVRR